MSSGRPFSAVSALFFSLLLGLVMAPRAGAAVAKEAVPPSDPFGRLTIDQVARRLGRPNTFIFDGNSPETYAQNHLPGAVRLNHKEIAPGVLPADKDATLIFYCANEL